MSAWRSPIAFLSLALSLVFLSECKTAGSKSATESVTAPSTATNANVPAAFVSAWNTYLALYSPTQSSTAAAAQPAAQQALFGTSPTPYAVQSFDPDATLAITDLAARNQAQTNNGCAPTFFPAKSTDSSGNAVAYRGVLVMLHGFSACPDQFYVLGQTFSALGYNVMIPLLPGQGRAPIPGLPTPTEPMPTSHPGAYFGQYLPGHSDWQRYEGFVTYMNQLVSLLPGSKYAMGLSGGSAAAHLLAVQVPGMYDRVMLCSPYYLPTGTVQAMLSLPQASDPTLLSTERGWSGCYAQAAAGRHGICEYTMDAIVGLSHFGTDVMAQAIAQSKLTRSWPVTQFVAIEGDSTASTLAVRQTFEAISDKQSLNMYLCFMRGVPHSFISTYDNPGVNMWWLPGFISNATAFFNYGIPYPTGAFSTEQTTDGTNDYYSLCAGT